MGWVIVEFASSSTEEHFLKTMKSDNKENKCNRLNTSDMQGNVLYKYVSEALTAKSRRLYNIAREFIKSSGYERCWTFNGNVYVLKREEIFQPTQQFRWNAFFLWFYYAALNE